MKNPQGWRKAEGVLPVEQVLADEYEALHGESLRERFEQISIEFTADQLVDIASIANHLRPALSGVPAGGEITPRLAVAAFLLQDEPLKSALLASTPGEKDPSFAAALARRLNALLHTRLVDEPVFRSFIDAGAIRELGEPAAADAESVSLLRANRALIEAVFPAEIQSMRNRRLDAVFSAIRTRDTAALCLSGGGIRSSTFALGVMQGLARHNLLIEFDYLSTVSGGGFSGGWLSAWMKRDGAAAVQKALGSHDSDSVQSEPEPVRSLRAFSHWLTPAAGAMSIDSWSMIATVMRNLWLNWMVLLPLLAAAIMLPRLLLAVLTIGANPPVGYEVSRATWALTYLFAAGVSLILMSAAFLEWVRISGDDFATGTQRSPKSPQFVLFFLLPRLAGSVIVPLAFGVSSQWRSHGVRMYYLGAAVLWPILAFAGILAVTAVARRGQRSVWSALVRVMKVLATQAVAIALVMIAAALMYAQYLRAHIGVPVTGDSIVVAEAAWLTLMPAVILLSTVVANQLYAGLTSDSSSDAEREWSARSDAWILVVVVAWLTSNGLVLFGSHVLNEAWQKLTFVGVSGVASWLALFTGKSERATESRKKTIRMKMRRSVQTLAGAAVLVCLLVGLSAFDDAVMEFQCKNRSSEGPFACAPANNTSIENARIDSLRGQNARAELLRLALTEQAQELFDRDSLFMKTLSASDPLTSGKVGDADSTLLAISHSATAAELAYDSLVTDYYRRVSLTQPNTRFLAGRIRDSSWTNYEERVSTQLNFAPPDHTDRMRRAQRTYEALYADFRKSRRSEREAQQVFDDLYNARYAPSIARESAQWRGVLLMVGIFLLVGGLFSTLVNTNTFSLHAMWRARAVRAFLGASRAAADRNPNPFTGFDIGDDVPMAALLPSRGSGGQAPMHVVNVTLNLAAGRELAWQQRKGESMTLTPLHAGSAFTGYRRITPTESGADSYGGKNGVSLGTAMAISGAAVSPSGGATTSRLRGMLLTFFNARLGWWLGNPGAAGRDTWKLSAPKQRVTPILAEMFGITSDRGRYVYLSDGGHFENLGVYEMVHRRCRFILVSDAGADPEYTFEDLGNAVRKARIDFGIPIEFGTMDIHGRGVAPGAHWATALIRYSAVDMPAGGKPEDYDGVLVYVKAAVYGKEPRDVVNYAKMSPGFPQESTTDQFFSESQFESYRELGSWIVDQMVEGPREMAEVVGVKAKREDSLLAWWVPKT